MSAINIAIAAVYLAGVIFVPIAEGFLGWKGEEDSSLAERICGDYLPIMLCALLWPLLLSLGLIVLIVGVVCTIGTIFGGIFYALWGIGMSLRTWLEHKKRKTKNA